MKHKAIVSITRSLELSVSHPATGEIRIRLDRIGAQHLAGALREFSGVPSRAVTLNAGVFNGAQGDLLSPKVAAKTRVVRLAAPAAGS